jgi:imidazolonepropionase-like amidohydrolase
MKKTLLSLVLLCSITIYSQEYFPVNNGVKTTNTNYLAFKNAKIIVSPSETINNGTLLIKNGKIIDVGTNVSIPKNATIVNLIGKSIYPSFIDAYSNFGIEKPKRANKRSLSPQYDSNREGYYWNDHIMPENNALDNFKFDEKQASELRKVGFGVVNTHIEDGIVRGTGILVALNSEGNNSTRLLSEKSAQYLSFSKSAKSNQVYPSSLMGSMALLRQIYLDANWYNTGNVNGKDLSLEALNRNKGLKQLFYAGDKLNILRADRIGDEFNIQYTIVGEGNEYELVSEIKKTNATLIIPLNFPEAFDVENPFQADYVSLEDMRYWNQAPSNPGVLAKNGIQFSFTTYGAKSLSIFKNNIFKSIKYGLDKTKALEALTTIPAKILGKESEIGTLSKGKQANFLITSGDLFDKKTKLFENWVQGTKNVIEDMTVKDLTGNYELTIDNQQFKMEITGEPSRPKIVIKKDSIKLTSSINYTDDWVGLIIKDTTIVYKLKSRILNDSNNLTGNAIIADGNSTNWTAIKMVEQKKDEEKLDAKKNKALKIVPLTYPNVGYGFKEKPRQETILFKNATVWTNEIEGILTNTDVLVKDGKIAKIGTNLSDRKATVIDATGKHLTSGIIDEHSHIAATSSNEVGQNSTAEVTMEDTIDYEDINLYRNLAGGVTIMQILHGSANPIGGRSAIIKLKWGEIGPDMIYKNSPKFIKFALGENVKQSNWQSFSRFPQSRMGVEQVFTDYFQRAKEYDNLKKNGKPYRKDLELETLAEILNKERFISCHSYVQSEINMLMKVADKFNFRINTFTHILEGYKVADKMLAHGVGGSTFSDWWAYKFEVNDAIPYNASIMHNVGITVAINSDDREMSRRLNQEAGKTIKYGNVSEEDAWKFVTLNPAKLLHIDDKVGSVKVGKDADLVLWNNHPLSVYTKAEKTLIEGKVYFDIEKDLEMRNSIKKERTELVNMMLNEKNNGAPTQSAKKRVKEALHCDTLD